MTGGRGEHGGGWCVCVRRGGGVCHSTYVTQD